MNHKKTKKYVGSRISKAPRVRKRGSPAPKNPSKFYAKIRQNRLKQFNRQNQRFGYLPNDLLISEHLHLKIQLEMKKMKFAVLAVVLFLTVIFGIWGNIFNFLLRLLVTPLTKESQNAHLVSLIPVVVAFLLFLLFSIAGVILMGMSEIKTTLKELLVVEEMRKKRNI